MKTPSSSSDDIGHSVVEERSYDLWVDQFLSVRARAALKQERPDQRFRLSEYAEYFHVCDLNEILASHRSRRAVWNQKKWFRY